VVCQEVCGFPAVVVQESQADVEKGSELFFFGLNEGSGEKDEGCWLSCDIRDDATVEEDE
jgi:hypothetical protein